MSGSGINPRWGIVDRAIGLAMTALGWLVLPVGLLLFLQWPLRDAVHAWSQQANDLAQWIFALYVAAAVTQATRAGAHLAIAAQRGRRWLSVLATLPWAAFVLLAGAPAVWRSVRGLEAFGETGDPGYFLVKLAGWLLALLMIVQGLLDLARRD